MAVKLSVAPPEAPRLQVQAGADTSWHLPRAPADRLLEAKRIIDQHDDLRGTGAWKEASDMLLTTWLNDSVSRQSCANALLYVMNTLPRYAGIRQELGELMEAVERDVAVPAASNRPDMAAFEAHYAEALLNDGSNLMRFSGWLVWDAIASHDKVLSKPERKLVRQGMARAVAADLKQWEAIGLRDRAHRFAKRPSGKVVRKLVISPEGGPEKRYAATVALVRRAYDSATEQIRGLPPVQYPWLKGANSAGKLVAEDMARIEVALERRVGSVSAGFSSRTAAHASALADIRNDTLATREGAERAFSRLAKDALASS